MCWSFIYFSVSICAFETDKEQEIANDLLGSNMSFCLCFLIHLWAPDQGNIPWISFPWHEIPNCPTLSNSETCRLKKKLHYILILLKLAVCLKKLSETWMFCNSPRGKMQISMRDLALVHRKNTFPFLSTDIFI